MGQGWRSATGWTLLEAVERFPILIRACARVDGCVPGCIAEAVGEACGVWVAAVGAVGGGVADGEVVGRVAVLEVALRFAWC